MRKKVTIDIAGRRERILTKDFIRPPASNAISNSIDLIGTPGTSAPDERCANEIATPLCPPATSPLNAEGNPWITAPDAVASCDSNLNPDGSYKADIRWDAPAGCFTGPSRFTGLSGARTCSLGLQAGWSNYFVAGVITLYGGSVFTNSTATMTLHGSTYSGLPDIHFVLIPADQRWPNNWTCRQGSRGFAIPPEYVTHHRGPGWVDITCQRGWFHSKLWITPPESAIVSPGGCPDPGPQPAGLYSEELIRISDQVWESRVTNIGYFEEVYFDGILVTEGVDYYVSGNQIIILSATIPVFVQVIYRVL